MTSSSNKALDPEQGRGTRGAVSSNDNNEAGNTSIHSTMPGLPLNFRELVQQVGSSDDPIAGMMDSNPELRAMMEDPDQMRLMMDIASNPQLRLEYMRNMDRALSNIESLPGGFNALANMVNDASRASTGSQTANNDSPDSVNPFTRLFPVTEPALINEDPMPNPWQRNTDSRSTTQQARTFSDMSAVPSMSQEGMTELMNSMFSEENIREVHRIMRDPETRSRILRDVLGEEGSQQVSSEMLENLVSNFDSISGNLRDSLPIMPPLGNMRAGREIEETEMQSKIQILKDMGFPNDEANRRALQTSGGDVNGAVEILLSTPRTI